jgi:hypothetical protein
MSPAHRKGLVGLFHAQLVENVMTSISNSNQTCNYLLRKIEIIRHKESFKQSNKENPVIEQMGNQLYQPKEEKFDEGIGK